MLAERIDLRNIKRVALAAPVLLFAAHFGCSTSNQKEAQITPSQTSGQPTGEVKGAQAAPTEQFSQGNQPTEPKTNLATRVPTLSAPEPENNRNSLIVHRGDYEYKLYMDVTLDEIINTANTLPQTSTKPKIIENLQTLRTVLEKNPDNTVYLFLLEQVLSINNDNCKGGQSIEFTKQIASWVKQKYPERYEISSALFELGPCSVIEERRAIVPREDYTASPIIGLEGFLVFHEKDHPYYSLDPDTTLDKLIGSPNDPNYGNTLLGFLKENKYIGPEAADAIKNLLQKAQQAELANPQDPAIIEYANSAADILNMHCFDHDRDGVLLKGFMRGVGSRVYILKPDGWPKNKRLYLDGKCNIVF